MSLKGVCVCVLLVACVPTRNGMVPDQSVIAANELAAHSLGGQDVFDVVRLIRPQFLSTRGPLSITDHDAGRTHVSVNGGPIEPLSVLSDIPINSVSEIRFLDPAAAMFRFGTPAHAGPVVLVTMRSRN